MPSVSSSPISILIIIHILPIPMLPIFLLTMIHKLINILNLLHISIKIIFTCWSTLHLHQGRDPLLVLGIDPAPLVDQGLNHRGRLVLGGLIISSVRSEDVLGLEDRVCLDLEDVLDLEDLEDVCFRSRSRSSRIGFSLEHRVCLVHGRPTGKVESSLAFHIFYCHVRLKQL